MPEDWTEPGLEPTPSLWPPDGGQGLTPAGSPQLGVHWTCGVITKRDPVRCYRLPKQRHHPDLPLTLIWSALALEIRQIAESRCFSQEATPT